MFQYWPPEDAQALQAKNLIQLKSSRSLERRDRLLNAKQRTIGQCKEVLDQIEYNQQKRREEEEEQQDYADFERRLKETMDATAEKQEIERQLVNDNLRASWDAQVAGRPLRAEHDLSDPAQLSKDKVPCHGIECGSSAAQVFDGEDLQKKERVRMQQLEQAATVEAQLKEHADAEAEEKAFEAAYAALAQQQYEQRVKVEADNATNRFRETRETHLINQELARMRIEREAEAKAADVEREAQHTEFIKNHPMWTESRTQGINRHGKIHRTEWKGMTPAELESIRMKQLRQTQFNNDRKQQELEAEAAYADQQAAIKQLRDQAYDARVAAKAQADYNNFTYLKVQNEAYVERDREEREYRRAPDQKPWPFGKSDR